MNTMKQVIGIAIGLALGFATWTPAQAVTKCPQADGSVVSVPDSVGCGLSPTKQEAPYMERMAQACAALYGSRPTVEGANRVDTAMLEYAQQVERIEVAKRLGVMPSWGQCDELQRQQIRDRMR